MHEVDIKWDLQMN